MAPAEKGARKAQKQSDDAQGRDNQSGGAKEASGSRKATEEGPASGDEHLESKQEGGDEEKGRGSGNDSGADGGDTTAGSGNRAESKDDSKSSGEDLEEPKGLRADTPASGWGSKGPDSHSLLHPGWRERGLMSKAEYDLRVKARPEPLQLVGVPASEMAYRNGAHLRDGYGGLAALQILERFSDQDLNDLESVLGAGVRSSILQSADQPRADSSLTLMLGSLTMQRKFAAVLTAFKPWHLAENAMNTRSYLKRLLVQYRHVKAALESSGTTSVRDVVNLRTCYDALRRESAAMEAFWQSEVGRVESEKQSVELRAKRNLVAQEDDHQHQLNAHADEIADLKEQLAISEALCDVLRLELREKTWGAWSFSDFLDWESSITVSENWKRLQELFAHFTAGGRPRSAWITNIHVLASVCGDYQAER
ncbi:uncharacterized protein IUM83_16960 [Phytophthora cinnamomi]|uniref:uncharacterized protein n=1 Tax=Phytophthora cinnamomi TaxID=4785 RepID=UPI00355A6549|nr:hypothetical protein IUM83_16960 [Phytophthora cinnamomi]